MPWLFGTGSCVLDVPCGTGRIAQPLADRRRRVVGLDAISAFARVAHGAGVPAIQADMRTSVVRPGSFDAAICLWGWFGYFTTTGTWRRPAWRPTLSGPAAAT